MKKGDEFNERFQVTSQVYQNFIKVFKDNNPLHVNENFARQKGFEGRVMHGNILGGFLSNFIGECLPVKNVVIHHQQLKFSKPIYLNDFLYFTAKIVDVYESVNAIEFKFSFSNQDKVKVAKGKIQIGLLE
jgi:3-hydroxybutyryl-CoA dehydratase